MAVTARDVANEVGLSQPTVSRILNGDNSHRASVATRKRVLEAAQRLGYRPNAVARSLRRGRTGIIGLHTDHNYDVRNDFLGAVIGGLQHACQERRWDLLLHSGLGRSPEELSRSLCDGRVDGLILHSSANEPLIEILRNEALPVIAIADVPPQLSGLTCDAQSGMAQLIELAWSRGHRRFVFIEPEIELSAVSRRRMAFDAELARRGAQLRAHLGIHYENAAPILEQVRALAPVVACCWNDRSAYNLLQACAQNNVDVPHEIAVMGFDGLRDEKLPQRQLVTADCRWDEVAAHALQVLAERIEAPEEINSTQRREIYTPVYVLDGDTV